MSNPDRLGLDDRLARIVDPSDPRVAEFRDIREKDLVGRRGRFIAEGRVVLRMLAASDRFQAEKLLILDSRLDGMRDILDRFSPDVPVMTCDRSVIDGIAGFPMHRGILAVARVPEAVDVNALLPGLDDDALVLVCAGISNHDNLGGLFRNAAAFGADFVGLDDRCCDPMYRKAVRVSVGTVLTVPYARMGSIEMVIEELTTRNFDILALSPSGGTKIGTYRPGRRTALVVGTEGEGLPDHVLKRLQVLRVPQVPSVDSLNVSVAAGIALHRVADAMGRV